MTTLLQELAIDATPGLDGPAIVPVNTYGLPSSGLTRQFRFAETTLALGVQDDVTGTYFALGGTGASTALPDEGLELEGFRYVHGPDLDLREPYTVGLILTNAPPPSLANSAQSIISARRLDLLVGWRIFTQQIGTEGITAGEVFGGYVDHVSEASGDNRQTISKPWSARLDHPYAMFIRHLGGGAMQIIMREENAITLLGGQWDIDEMNEYGYDENPIPLLIGGNMSDLNKSSMIFDVACVWNRAISTRAMEVFTTAGLALAADRGRT
jgi:hypothetical protein